jgi:hypothetical protein
MLGRIVDVDGDNVFLFERIEIVDTATLGIQVPGVEEQTNVACAQCLGKFHHPL